MDGVRCHSFFWPIDVVHWYAAFLGMFSNHGTDLSSATWISSAWAAVHQVQVYNPADFSYFPNRSIILPNSDYHPEDLQPTETTTAIQTTTAATIMKYFTQHLPTETSLKRDCLDQAIWQRFKKLAKKTSHCLQKEVTSAKPAKKPKQSALAYGEYSIPYIFC